MTASALLAHLTASGFTLRLQSGKLLISPFSKLDDVAKADLAKHRAEVIELLNSCEHSIRVKFHKLQGRYPTPEEERDLLEEQKTTWEAGKALEVMNTIPGDHARPFRPRWFLPDRLPATSDGSASHEAAGGP